MRLVDDDRGLAGRGGRTLRSGQLAAAGDDRVRRNSA